MPVGTVTRTISCDGDTFPPGSGAAYTTDGAGVEKHVVGGVGATVAFPAGLTGTAAWGGSTATITLAAGHGLVNTDKVALFGAFGHRVGLIVSNALTTSVDVTNANGSGTSLPTTSTATIVLSKAVELADATWDGSGMSMLVVYCDQVASADFIDGSGDSLISGGAYTAVAAEPYYYLDGDPIRAAPFTDPVVSINCYNGSLTDAYMVIKAILDT